MPRDTPVTSPVVLTVAMLTSLLLHAPPVAVSTSVVVPPTHTVEDPVITLLVELAPTVIARETKQPVGKLYVSMPTPEDIPVTTPEAMPTVKTAEELDDQMPPAVASISVMELPTHTVVGPEIAAGAGLTVTVMVAVPVPVM